MLSSRITPITHSAHIRSSKSLARNGTSHGPCTPHVHASWLTASWGMYSIVYLAQQGNWQVPHPRSACPVAIRSRSKLFQFQSVSFWMQCRLCHVLHVFCKRKFLELHDSTSTTTQGYHSSYHRPIKSDNVYRTLQSSLHSMRLANHQHVYGYLPYLLRSQILTCYEMRCNALWRWRTKNTAFVRKNLLFGKLSICQLLVTQSTLFSTVEQDMTASNQNFLWCSALLEGLFLRIFCTSSAQRRCKSCKICLVSESEQPER